MSVCLAAAAHRLVSAGPAQTSDQTKLLKVKEKHWNAQQRKTEINRLWGLADVQRAYKEKNETYLAAVRGKSAIH